MTSTSSSFFPKAVRRASAAGLTALLGLTSVATAVTTTLADQPVFATNVPGNLALVLSVEYPTANSVANLGDYADTSLSYLGYFDPQKCYNYVYNSTTPSLSYFQPTTLATGKNKHTCSTQWSGNFMNWATMQTIDPFRWALSGGYRSTDMSNLTVIEKAWQTGQGGTGNYPNRGTDEASGSTLPSLTGVTPFSTWSHFNSSIAGNGNRMVFWGSSSPTPIYKKLYDLSDASTADDDNKLAYQVYIRVKVCDALNVTDASGKLIGTGGLESNCVQYGSNYKPEGLLQQYSNQIRYSAFGYLNGTGATRQGGVLREPMGFIGPTQPQPLSTSVTVNSRPEWDAATGIMSTNPDTALAAASGVSQSGVMNYLNKFGETSHIYMTEDNVSELYYAALRYYENLGNVPEWINSATATELDGFPAANTWSDPIVYYCQKNFILGIGDDHTHVDYNVGTGSTPSAMVATGSRPKPSSVSSDTLNLAARWTSNLLTLEGMSQTPWLAGCCAGATNYIAGLAYGAHVTDIRPAPSSGTDPMPGMQTISTYWMDVEENQHAENLNQYYLATKYGGFTVPSGYSMSNTTPLLQSEWDTSGNSINMNGTTHLQPDNYYLAGNANAMVTGLKSAFSNIATANKANTTSLSLSTSVTTTSGATSFATQYNPLGWTGTITASTLSFAADGTTSTTFLWSSDGTLQAQLASNGWDTARNVATWNGSAGVAFRAANLTSQQQTALTPSYATTLACTSASCPYLNYLRGDQSNEVGVSGGAGSLRARKLLLGDIVDAKLTPVGPPARTFSESSNPYYAAFKSANTARPTMVYAGANDGMLHAFVGLTGTEQFAYVPSALYQGPNGTPQVDGLAQIGNPNYAHHNYVDGTPLAFDIDFANTFGASGSSALTWHTLLIGGLGKGGKSYYAIDVTNPTAMSTEAAVAADVKWEFTDATMGYSYGAPVVVKTAKYGWVVALTSGYNNSDGYGYLYLVNPVSGALLEKIATPQKSSGLTQASGYVQDYSDYTADSIYVGDLNGQLWRFDLRGAKGSTTPYPAPTLLATLTDGSGNAQPVTTAPLIEIHPTTRKRYVLVGTGQLLSPLDVSSTGIQSFYAILDGTAGGFNTSLTTPLNRSNFMAVSAVNLLTGVTLAANQLGWYTDLGSSSSTSSSGVTTTASLRVVVNPAAYNGVVSFAALAPIADVCQPGGTSQVYALDFANAKSVLTTGLAFFSTTSAVIEIKIVKNSDTDTTEILAGTASGGIPTIPANLTGTFATRILNWREIPTAD